MKNKDSVYIVTYGGTPVMVFWDVRSAAEFIERTVVTAASDPEDYFVHEAPAMNPYTWIVEAMRSASKQPVVPNYSDALDWMISEVGEAAGARVGLKDAWLRNHPEKHTQDDLDWEIGQAILMGILALGFSPFGIIRDQLEKWGYDDVEFQDDSTAYYNMLFNFPGRDD